MDDYSAFIKENAAFVRQRITQLRMQSNMSEYGLSSALGKSPGYIQSICNGSFMPSLAGLFQIMYYFNLTPAEFFDPDLNNPTLWNQMKESMKQLSDEELQDILAITKRFRKK